MYTTGGNVGIGTISPGYALDVTGNTNFTGTLTRSGIKLPRFDNGSFSAASISIPILFNDTQYNTVELKLKYNLVHLLLL